MRVQYEPLAVAVDCCFVSVEAALSQIGDDARYVSSDVYVSTQWEESDARALRDLLQENGCLANRVRRVDYLQPHEWYVECCGTRVGCNPP